MELNPLVDDLRKAEHDIEGRKTRLADARSDLRWLGRFDRAAEASRCDALRGQISDLETTSRHKTEELDWLKSLTPSFRSAASKAWWNPGDWFADRSEEERTLKNHRKKMADIEAHLDRLGREAKSARALLKKAEANLARFAKTDAASLKLEIAEIERSLPGQALELENLRSQKAHLDLVLGRRAAELGEKHAAVRAAEARLEQARDIEQRMSEAANGYERKMLHDECSKRFGKSSPRSVVSDQVRVRDRAARDLATVEGSIRQEMATELARGRARSGGRSEHHRAVRQWIALAQLEAWLYENAHTDVQRLTDARADAESLRRRLTTPQPPRRSQPRR